MQKEKLILPISILLASIFLGGFFYASQISKQESIERQQWIGLQDEKSKQETKNTLEKLKLKQDECEALSAGVKKKWNNVMGVIYDGEVWLECVVVYTDAKTGEVETSPLKFMKDS